jgi:RNA polymerase sigma-70 factor (ECF subfamily)
VEVDSIPLAEQADEKEEVQETLRESVDEVLSALAALPEKYRLVINLYAIDKMSHREIAEQLGISEGGSKSLLSRGRVMLKELLANKKKR